MITKQPSGFTIIHHSILLCAALSFFLAGCDSRETPAVTTPTETVAATATTTAVPPAAATKPALEIPPASSTTMLLQAPTALKQYETPSQALQQWYTVRGAQPALLLYSNDPLLQPTGPDVQKNLLAHLDAHDQNALRSDIADPVILPTMTLHAALEGACSQRSTG